MRQALLVVILLPLAFQHWACGGGDNSATMDWLVYWDVEPGDGNNPPDVPSHVFDLLQEQTTCPETKCYDGEDPPDVQVLPDADLVSEDLADLKEEELTEDTWDGGCIPACEFEGGAPKECGPDGCGSICGYCDYEHICVSGECKPYCPPQCAGKQCGPDGCYGECPPGCDDGYKCGDDGLCYPDCQHDENCEGKQCGPDDCGGTCGYCGSGFLCNEATGQCKEDPCGTIDKEKGKCVGDNLLVECVNGYLVETQCSSLGADFFCQWDAVSQKFICKQGCVPKCTFPDETPKECGYDGCYGECGQCPQGWQCSAGFCFPIPGGDCGWITETGTCIDNILFFCNNGILYKDDCVAMGKTCGFATATMKFQCQ